MSRLQVFVLIDALGWELVQRRRLTAEYLPHQQRVPTMLGFSSGIIPSILTGRTPSETGMWNLVYYDPEKSPFGWTRRLGRAMRLFDYRIGRRLLTEAGRRLLGMGANFDVSVEAETLGYFHWAESRNIYAHHGVPGQKSIFDLLAEKNAGHCIYSYKDSLSDQKIIEQAERDIRGGDEQVYFLYLCELDMFLHLHRHEPEKIAEKLDWYEEALRRVFAAARERDAQARLGVFSDHGMTPVVRHCDLAGEVAACGLRTPRDYLAVYDSTMARFWFFNDAAREKIVGRLGGLDYARWLTDDELREFGVYFEDRRYGERVLLLEPGAIIAEGGFNGRGWRPKGMHGYIPGDEYSDACFLSSEEPGVELRTVKDIFTVMREALG